MSTLIRSTYISILLVAANSFAAQSNITCSGSSCSIDSGSLTRLTPNQMGFAYYKTDLSSTRPDLTIKNSDLPTDSSVTGVFEIKSGINPLSSLTLDLRAQVLGQPGGSAIVFGDVANSLYLNTSGYSGSSLSNFDGCLLEAESVGLNYALNKGVCSGLSASQVCAIKFKSRVFDGIVNQSMGITGQSGATQYDAYLARRNPSSTGSGAFAYNPSSDPRKCDSSDVAALSTFSCPSGYNTSVGSTTYSGQTYPSVLYGRTGERSKCSAVWWTNSCTEDFYRVSVSRGTLGTTEDYSSAPTEPYNGAYNGSFGGGYTNNGLRIHTWDSADQRSVTDNETGTWLNTESFGVMNGAHRSGFPDTYSIMKWYQDYPYDLYSCPGSVSGGPPYLAIGWFEPGYTYGYVGDGRYANQNCSVSPVKLPGTLNLYNGLGDKYYYRQHENVVQAEDVSLQSIIRSIASKGSVNVPLSGSLSASQEDIYYPSIWYSYTYQDNGIYWNRVNTYGSTDHRIHESNAYRLTNYTNPTADHPSFIPDFFRTLKNQSLRNFFSELYSTFIPNNGKYRFVLYNGFLEFTRTDFTETKAFSPCDTSHTDFVSKNMKNFTVPGSAGDNSCSSVDFSNSITRATSLAADIGSVTPTFAYIGKYQDPSFGVEQRTCSTYSGGCNGATMIYSEKVGQISNTGFSAVSALSTSDANTIGTSPTGGTNGTNPGRATIFLYDVIGQTIQAKSDYGAPSVPGSDDLMSIQTPSTKYCASVKDATGLSGANLLTTYAVNPEVSVDKINYVPLRSAPVLSVSCNLNPNYIPGGTEPRCLNASAQAAPINYSIFTKIDPSVQYWLKGNTITSNPVLTP